MLLLSTGVNRFAKRVCYFGGGVGPGLFGGAGFGACSPPRRVVGLVGGGSLLIENQLTICFCRLAFADLVDSSASQISAQP